MSAEKIQQLSDRILKLVDQAVSNLESENGLDDRGIRSLETINKIVTVLAERERGRKTTDPMDSLSDEELLEALKD